MVECEAGESVVIKARAIDPITQKIITDAHATVEADCIEEHEPGQSDDVTSCTVPMRFDGRSRHYLASLNTRHFRKGVWKIKTAIEGGTGGYRSWTYTKVTVK